MTKLGLKIIIGATALAGLGLGIAAITLGPLRGPDMQYMPLLEPFEFSDGRKVLVQKFEVTSLEWNRCFDAGACTQKMKIRKTSEDFPATGLNWMDVNEYLTWLSAASRHEFRLPTQNEWNEMAHEVLPKEKDPIFTDPELSWAATYLMEPQVNRSLRPSGSFETTADGIVDLNGNVWEWTADCYSGDSGNLDLAKCPAYFVAGEHVAAIPIFTRDPARGGCAVGSPPAHLGLRLVTDSPVPGV